MTLALRLALRDLGSNLHGFRVFLGCLIIGVAAIAGVGSLTTAIVEGLRQQGQVLLGGDVELQLTQRAATPEERDALAASGIVSEVVTLRTMARNLANQERGLVELKAVDGRYPLYGALRLDPGGDPEEALAQRDGLWGAVIAPELQARLGVRIGDRLSVGATTVEVRAIVTHEPDRVNDGFTLAPRLMIARDALTQTGLLALGSLRRHSYRVKLPPGTDLAAWRAGIEADFPEAGWRIRDREGSAPRVREFVGRVRDFLTLVGLTALVVGGVGVGNAVRSHLERKVATIATLKTLGATTRTVFGLYLAQVLTLAGAGIAIGVVLGAALPHLVVAVAGDRLPVTPSLGVYPLSLGAAALYGFLVTLAFALWPLAGARDVPAARLFRQQVGRRARRRPGDLVGVAATAALLLLMPFVGSQTPALVAWFEAGAVAAVALLVGLALAIKHLARKAPRLPRPVLRLAVANLHRPGAPTTAVVLSLGLGLTLFTTLALVEGNLNRQIAANLPAQAPSFFFVDIQKADVDAFLDRARAIDGVIETRAVPYLRGRITHVDGVPAEQA
ncbi:MAG: FtsX-like permease family protein, partial [Alphaproteobacteria bacterium]